MEQRDDGDRMTEDERAALDKVADAIACGDDEAMYREAKNVRFQASSLMMLKCSFGAEWVREKGLNTELADKVYGLDWLDREEDPHKRARRVSDAAGR